MATLEAYLTAGADNDLISWRVQQSAMELFGCSCATVEEAILTLGLLPARYQRNRQTISIAGQQKLFRSRVTVIGCGGLGGYVIEQLARLGVGELVVVDPDVFEEHNLNRQLLSSLDDLGKSKVAAAVARVSAINPAVTVTPCEVAFNVANGPELLAGSRLAVDALDNIPTRLDLAEICAGLDLPLVHGAIGGWSGHVTTQFPGDKSVEDIYCNWIYGKGMEQQQGNPAFTPAVVASLQVAEACKILLGEPDLLRKRMLTIDLQSMTFNELHF
jgi:molybdopterin/thiamine biosynthesis adenylyltransferase